ncbi:site-specific DNA-methyltransferase (cytosine-N4-specific) [Cupriavidus phytorum]|uniref:Site-specific DNA-methyltransferase (Cytosine-N4-specific) n=1 Tax=Cupriavidus phytorum TaxID=3024399 RepID=A0A2W7NZH7_9BURK|nr:DNA methyltransferase [Cupriavidus alkaliphilus]PZX25403.1 site-specific DNA-methyltransferase (cytosine-N4-specific) [Cupriavidus alkaliphilus]
MSANIDNTPHLSTAEVARLAGIHKDTLLRWLRAGSVQEPRRDRHGWRHFSTAEAERIRLFAKSADASLPTQPSLQSDIPHLGNLDRIDWDFAGAKTNYLTHSIHPYPAKFIPQIPNALIQELSGVGDTIGDIFCGSGTTLVEALTLKRHAVGIDANPLACLISKVKTTALSEEDARLLASLADEIRTMGEAIDRNASSPLLNVDIFKSKSWRPSYDKLEFWFQPDVIEELAEIKERCNALTSKNSRDLALVAFSAIIVAVSKQDSDTRYVRREKGILPGETCKRFARTLDQTLRVAAEFTELAEPRFNCKIVEASLLQAPDVPQLDLMVCSPPYPNAYSYHLYHMTRMLWLEMDQPKFKKEEIGSHRKYSSKAKTAATVDTFRTEFNAIFEWLKDKLKPGGFACFVVGDSTLRGERINNADLISAAGAGAGFKEVARLTRNMQATKKAFNPAIGKIKTEDILILENRAGE